MHVPVIIHFNRVFQEINHQFWGTSIYGNHQICTTVAPKHLNHRIIRRMTNSPRRKKQFGLWWPTTDSQHLDKVKTAFVWGMKNEWFGHITFWSNHYPFHFEVTAVLKWVLSSEMNLTAVSTSFLFLFQWFGHPSLDAAEWCIETFGWPELKKRFYNPSGTRMMLIRWMEEILHHLGWLKPYK